MFKEEKMGKFWERNMITDVLTCLLYVTEDILYMGMFKAAAVKFTVKLTIAFKINWLFKVIYFKFLCPTVHLSHIPKFETHQLFVFPWGKMGTLGTFLIRLANLAIKLFI